ncbi:helix-turn-helix domain-containing protein [Actinokineospora pegani]|uniref:helix-turn-helix domain-containing protein n=1 Tax=Actinokineospora pegani TaxID=2654637 RepID=UPI0012E9C2B3|nr:helix-turn-helix transcriptional regulator [Actinokineospora pegani]
MASKKHTPTVRLRRLAGELRGLREGANLSQQTVVDKTNLNPATLYRVETAKARPQRRTLMTLLDLYELEGERRAYLLDLFTNSKKPGWLQPYHSDLPDEYTAYISFENEARSVRKYDSLFIPGLLQNEDYARAVIRGGLPAATDTEVEDRVRARMDRQPVLTRESGPLKFWAVIDEAALRRVVGSPAVMRAQLQHVIDAAKAPNVTVQVIPFDAGAHPGMSGQFSLMDFPDPLDADLVYIDSMAGDLFLESEADISRYRAMFDTLVAVALSPKDSMALLAEAANKFASLER